tara:strand:+ start:1345 stop:1587 length:243 start_codon:yes stop_codon:yes gene_type:complete
MENSDNEYQETDLYLTSLTSKSENRSANLVNGTQEILTQLDQHENNSVQRNEQLVKQIATVEKRLIFIMVVTIFGIILLG